MKLKLIALLAAGVTSVAIANQPSGTIDFRRDVQPILRERCVRCHGAELRGGVIAAGITPTGEVNYAYPPNLTTVCGGPFTGHALIKSLADIYTTIEQGRNDMPSWSIRFKGPLDDQQIGDLVNYIIEINKKTIPFDQNVCINPKAKGFVTPVVAAQ